MSDLRGEDQGMVDDLLNIEEGLTTWEVEFAESLHRYLKNYPTLTETQRSKVREILDEKG